MKTPVTEAFDKLDDVRTLVLKTMGIYRVADWLVEQFEQNGPKYLMIMLYAVCVIIVFTIIVAFAFG